MGERKRERERGGESRFNGASLQLRRSNWPLLASVLQASVVWLNVLPCVVFRNKFAVLCFRDQTCLPSKRGSFGI